MFRVVSASERDALNRRVQKVCGDVNASCGNIEGFRHLLDVGQMMHVQNRHSDPRVEERHGQIAVTREDFYRIPEVVYPSNLVECDLTGKAPRLVYSRGWSDGALVVVEELRAGRKEAVVVTLYKRK